MENEYLLVGVISKPVGLSGEVKVYSSTHFKDIRFSKGNKLFLFHDGIYNPITIKSYREKDSKFVILSFLEFDSIDSIEKLYNDKIYTLKDPSILSNNEYFYSDLESCDVFDENNNLLGHVASVEEFPSQLTLKVKKNEEKDGFFYVPFIEEFILKVDIKNHLIIIKVIDGLL